MTVGAIGTLALSLALVRPATPDTAKDAVDEAAADTASLSPRTTGNVAPTSDQPRTAETALADPEFDCPVTRPTTGFVPPKPWNETPADDDLAWYGTAELWTLVSVDDYIARKSIWWSEKFTDGSTQPTPEITIRYERLDTTDEPMIQPAPGTNAFTSEYGWSIINGREPAEPGCWEATGTFDGVSLSYVFLVTP